ncbi:MAG: RsmD family RNA methyltransferase [Candidatus Omnitrophica bacterium]|nr:RsmD family RNA methyltransferase [Candidatus Omnitrophota bacterium]
MTDVTVTIEKLVFGGDGLGFLNGKACFVEGALPQEKVLARVLVDKSNFAKARLIRVLDPAPERVVPPCPYVERCGGCQYQHLPYPEELRWKQNQVRESFDQHLKLDTVLIESIRPSPKHYGYRNSIALHRTSAKNGFPQRLGFIGRDNRSKILIDHCLLADDGLKSIFAAPHTLKRNEEKRSFKLDEKGRVLTNEDEKLYKVRVGGTSFWTSSMGFFQNNLGVTELIAKQLAEWVEAINPPRFLDLYAGVGTFPLLAARKVPEIYCFEESPYSTGCVRRNFKETGVPLTGVFTGKVEKTFPRFLLANPKPGTLVFLDPPRQGIASSLASLLSKATDATDIIFLACDLQILLRDLRLILAGGRLRVRTVIPFDMFPRTKHIELLVWLQKT